MPATVASRTTLRVPLLALVLVAAGSAAAAAAPIAIHGRVEGEGGAPLRDAVVRLYPTLGSRETAELQLAGKLPVPAKAEAKVDASGDFRLDAPGPGVWRLEASAAGRAPLEWVLQPLVEEAWLPTAKLAADAALEVRVVDAAGKPVAEAAVVAQPVDMPMLAGRGWLPPNARIVADAQGKAVVPRAAKAKLDVTAAAPGGGVVKVAGAGGGSVRATFPGGVRRELSVVGADGRPAAGAMVMASPSQAPVVAADAAGKAVVVAPAAGPLTLMVEDKTGASARLTVEPPPKGETPKPLRVALTRASSLTGRVIDAESRRPVAGAVVFVSGRTEVWAVSDGAGAFTLERVPAGSRARALRAAAPGYMPAWADAGGSNAARPSVTLALRPSAALVGSVTDQKGRPVAGVEVDAVATVPRSGGIRIMRQVGMTRGMVLKARTDERGRYRIAPLATGAPYDVTFRRAGYAPLAKQVPPAPRDRSGELHVTLLPGSRGIGRVSTLQGEAIAGARVTLTKQEAGGSTMVMRRVGERAASDAEATSDAGGRFTLADLPAGRFELDVTAAGFAGSKVPGIEVPAVAGEVDLGTVKLAGGSPVEGRVVGPQGQPIEGAEVFVLDGMMGMMPLSRWAVTGLEPAASSAPDGFFRVEDRAAGQKVDLAVRHSGYTVERALGVLAPTEEPVVITLRPASAIRGRVVNADGDPVAEAQLQLIMERAGGGMSFMTSLGNTTTGDDGRFAIEDVDPGTVRINVNATGYLPFERAGVEVPAGKDLDGLELVLRPGATVLGTVTTPDGLPAIGAYVSVVVEQRGSPMRMAGGAAETDGEGRYRLEGVEPGPRTLEAQHDELDRAVADLEVRAGENQLDLRLGGGQEVSGRVVGSGGQPVGSASVSLAAPGQMGGGNRGAITDAGGLFTITGVPDGTYEAMATHADYGDGRTAAPLTVAGAPVSGITIELPVGATVVGALRGLSMAEVARTQVWASQQQTRSGRQGTVSYDGRYRIAGLVPGDWTVSGRLQEGGRQAQGRVTIAAGVEEETLDLDFEGGLKLSGRVREEGRAAAGALVMARGKDVSGSAQGRTDQAGAYRVENLRPGRYDVEVFAPESGLRGNQTVTLERDQELDFDLRGTRVSGRVLEAGSGDPIPGVSISVEAVDESAERIPFRGSVSTDEGGRFSVNVSSDGAWKLSAEKAGYARAETRVDVGRDPVDDVEIRLSPTQGITLQVSRTAGSPPANVYVAVLHGHGGALLTQPYSTGEGGRVRLTTVPPGTWEVLVRSEDSGTERVTATSPGPPVAVLLAPQASLALIVPDLASEAVIAKATLTGGDGRPFASIEWSTVRREFSFSYGRTTINGLPAGTWKVDVVAPDGRRWSGSAVTAPGGTATVELD